MPDAINRNGTGDGSGCRHLPGGDAMSKFLYVQNQDWCAALQAVLDEYQLGQITREEAVRKMTRVAHQFPAPAIAKIDEDRPCA